MTSMYSSPASISSLLSQSQFICTPSIAPANSLESNPIQNNNNSSANISEDTSHRQTFKNIYSPIDLHNYKLWSSNIQLDSYYPNFSMIRFFNLFELGWHVWVPHFSLSLPSPILAKEMVICPVEFSTVWTLLTIYPQCFHYVLLAHVLSADWLWMLDVLQEWACLAAISLQCPFIGGLSVSLRWLRTCTCLPLCFVGSHWWSLSSLV